MWTVTRKSQFTSLLAVFVVFLMFVSHLLFILDTSLEISSANTKHPQKSGQEAKRVEENPSIPGHFHKFIDIEIYSRRENTSVSVNWKVVSSATKDTNRGINLVVLNQVTGVVMSARSFDTYADKEESERIINFIEEISDKRIICFSTKDEASYSLSKSVRRFIKTLGSSYIDQLGWRDTWALVVQKKGDQYTMYAEGYQTSKGSKYGAQPVLIHTRVELQEQNMLKCPQWLPNTVNLRRREFCDLYEGYAAVCNCLNPLPLEISPPSLANGRKLGIPVAVMASNRPLYLYRMLQTLLRVEGLDVSKITVYEDGFHREPVEVAKLFGLRVEQFKVAGLYPNSRIAQHYKKSLTSSFERHPDAQHLVILEEDLDVSPDILDYFSQMIPIWDRDKSIYCISAWNDQGYAHTASDPSMAYRVETMPGLGWVLSRRLYKDELEPIWLKPHEYGDWDMWMRHPLRRKGRECIIPDVSRTYHFGSKGLNVQPSMQWSYFKKHAFNNKTNVKFSPHLMDKESYEKEIKKLLRVAEVLDHSKTPCSNVKDFVPDTKGKIYVFYIHQSSLKDFTTWINVARCFRLWDLDPRGFHKGLWRFWIKENHILVVSCPFSPYAAYKPKGISPIFMPNKETRPNDD